MTNTAAQTTDLIRRAYANLQSMRQNMNATGYVFQQGFYAMLDHALDHLQQAGMDVAEWRIPANRVGTVNGDEFRAILDAVLLHFELEQKDTTIGFHS